MDNKTLDRVGDFLKNATPEQVTQLAQDMADKAPHLIQVPLNEKESITALIKLQINGLADSKTSTAIEYNIGYVHGLIAGAYMAGLLDDDENTYYHYEADKAYGQTHLTLKEDKQDD